MTDMQVSKSVVESAKYSMAEGTSLFVGEKASSMLLLDAFLDAWDALYDSCSWATIYQSRKFVVAWYLNYSQTYTPIIVQNVECGKLTGLLTMAMDKTMTIVGAGDSQAEYQVWIADEAMGEIFGSKALNLVFKTFKRSKILLRFIPENAPLHFIKNDAGLKRHSMLRFFKQPIMQIDDILISRELQKKNKKEKLNRLKRLGRLEFERIFDNDDFRSILETLAFQFDFRKGAMYNRSFFLNDPRRKRFLISLFELGLLHSTVLKLNGEIIASNVGTIGKNCVHLQGVNSHHPSYGRYSPGIIHFLMLGKLLGAEGTSEFDLTPGDNSYKDDLATGYRMTYELTVCSLYNNFAHHTIFHLLEQIKKGGNKYGVKPAKFSEMKRAAANWIAKFGHIKSLPWEYLTTSLSRRIRFSGKKIRRRKKLYAMEAHSGLLPLKINSLQDLMLYHPNDTLVTRREFLAGAMRRFESGQKVYTYSTGNRLVYCVWLGNKSASIRAGALSVNADIAENVKILQGMYCNNSCKHKLANFIESVVHAIVNDGKDDFLYALTEKREIEIAKALEIAGFEIDAY